MKRTKVAVTGAAGQVGSVLIRRLFELENVDVVAMCRNTISAGLVHFSCPNCDIRVGSITGGESARHVLGDCEVVINCALATGGGPRKTRASNRQIIDGITSLENLKLLVHFSSISVYGDFIQSSNGSKSTFSLPRPDNEYGRSKLFVEQYAGKICELKKIRHYIIRLGHVIGAGTDRSREIVEFSKTARFGLPFEGSLPSNTIHVERLASIVCGLISSPVPEGIYNVAEEGKTWGEVFDWHTESLGLPAVTRVSPVASEPMRSIYVRRSIIGDFLRWVRGLPFLNLVKSPAVMDLALRLLVRAPETFTNKLFNINRQMGTAKQISALAKVSHPPLGPVYLSQAMPGRYLRLPNGTIPPGPSADKLRDDLRKWHLVLSQPGF
jgi:nucleoside-diphosphate-sugar epimerase